MDAADGYASPVAPIEQWPTIGSTGPVSLASTATQVTPGWGKRRRKGEELDYRPGAQRWTVDAWALLRPREGVYRLDEQRSAQPGLASAGSLGGSQAGMRISWKPLSSIGVHLRASTALIPKGSSARTNRRSAEKASLGISWKPIRACPFVCSPNGASAWVRRSAAGAMPLRCWPKAGFTASRCRSALTLDGYGQAGVVGAQRRDLFADGALTATYPFMPRFAIGGGHVGRDPARAAPLRCRPAPELPSFDPGCAPTSTTASA